MSGHLRVAVLFTLLGLSAAGCSDENSIVTSGSTCSDIKPAGDCLCVGGAWRCSEKEECPAECPSDCDEEGRCHVHSVSCPDECIDDCDEEGRCHVHRVSCPDECIDDCDEEGRCYIHPVSCPDECIDDCDVDGVCIEGGQTICPMECPDDCDENGECQQKTVVCPEACPDHCDLNGECVDGAKCPEECPENCDDDGICKNAVCPDECPECDENGGCIAVVCPAECPNDCDENGACKVPVCPAECPNRCDDKGKCLEGPVQCPAECPESCDFEGMCDDFVEVVCPSECPNDCDENGACPVNCPVDCPDNCDENGACIVVCPAACPDACDAEGKCIPVEHLTVVAALENVGVSNVTKLAGKKIVVIGNSQLYKGWAAKPASKENKYVDTAGHLAKIISKYEKASATVYNYTCGNCYISQKNSWSGCASDKPCKNEYGALGYYTGMKPRTDVSYVIASGAAAYRNPYNTSNNNKYNDILNLKKVFPNAKILYLIQLYDYIDKDGKGHDWYSKYQNTLKGKCEVANWGKVAKTFIDKSGYDRYHFVLNDKRHPNLLSGYITAATAYSYLTNTSATHLPHDTFTESQMKSYANSSTYKCDSKFISVFNNNTKMADIKKTIDSVNGIKEVVGCTHAFGAPENITLEATSNTHGVGQAVCSKCHQTVRVRFSTDQKTAKNVMKIESSDITNAGLKTAEEYMKAGLGNVFRQTADHTWGRQGYSGISNGGMASMCDGRRARSDSNVPMTWTVKSTTEKYYADGKSGGAYVSLIGYSFKSPVTVGSFALFTANKAITSYDILGRSNNTWKVLYSGNSAYQAYTSNTYFMTGSFAQPVTIDAVQIGVKTVSALKLELMEFELYNK